MLAASRGDLDTVRRLIAADTAINPCDAFGNTALMYAASGGHADVVELLLRTGADLRIKNKLGRNCLQSAESRGHGKVVSILLSAELLPSIREGDSARVTELLDLGVDVNLQLIEGWTPLMVAALDNQAEVAKILLSRGADARRQNSKGLTAEMIALRKSHPRIIELLRWERRAPRPATHVAEVPQVAEIPQAVEVPHVAPLSSDLLDLDSSPPVAASVDESEVVN